MYDWIETYVEATSDVLSPEIFRLWSAITAVSGVLERKVWTVGSAGKIYPSLFTVLVGPPASGKDNAIRPIRDLWAQVQGLHISPDNVTKAALIDALSRSMRMVMHGAEALNFCAMVVPAPEFGVFFTHHDTEFLSALNHIYTSPAIYLEERRTKGKIEIHKPHLVILGGTQPDFLNDFFPEAAWGMGFTSRTIMVYAEGAPPGNIIGSAKTTNTSGLGVSLKKMFELKGEMHWADNAAQEINAWNRAGCPPVPNHSKLLNYAGRRSLHVAKLSMISAVSRTATLLVTVDDFERAKNWLLEAEVVMPDIFRAMGARSDQQILNDLHLYLYRLYSSVAIEKRKPLHTKDIYEFLHSRVTSDKIPKLTDTAEKLGYIRRGKYPDEWIPKVIGHFGTM